MVSIFAVAANVLLSMKYFLMYCIKVQRSSIVTTLL